MPRGGLDLTFITNKEGEKLIDRFKKLIKDTEYFDILVAYFYLSGFHLLWKSLEKTKKIRILIGIGTSKKLQELVQESLKKNLDYPLSHQETKNLIEEEIISELEDCDDNKETEEGIKKFIEWVQNKKIEIRAYPSRSLHAKVYIMTFKKGDRDVGRVITGSSNFTQSGLKDNLEFNVELKNRSDYEFALKKFNELWEDSVDLSEKFVEVIQNKTWFSQTITPYQLYLKFLYEYFKEQLNIIDEDLFLEYKLQNFIELEYQKQAVLNAKKILEEYGGVFISDVVGLGKTYIVAMLIKQIGGKTLVIAPPALINKTNPGSWPSVFFEFGIPAEYESIGKLEDVLNSKNLSEYVNIIIDESHRFREEKTERYSKLAEICRGKRVILVSATPYNNYPKDILAQIKLFQNPRKSTIPGVPNLERFFENLDKEMKKAKSKKDYENYINHARNIGKEIREKVLKYIMVRRTRKEIEKYFAEDLRKNNIKFPEVEAPKPLYYQFNEEENKIFDKTIRLIAQKLTYARYKPLLYYKKEITPIDKLSQQNLSKLMKILLIKRFESSQYAFKKSLERFIRSYELFIKSFDNGYVYISKKNIRKILDLLEQDNDEEIQRLIDEEKAEKYPSKDFDEKLREDLEDDLKILKEIQDDWNKIKKDPKLEKLLLELETNPILKNKKIIIFTESKDTAEYLKNEIAKKFGNIVLVYHGKSSETVKHQIIENFDARATNQKDDFRILISTDILSEGVSLHKSNIVINYDIPWNPTKIMQRTGRVNRIGTEFNKIYTFHFFPTEKVEEEIMLKKIAAAKVNTFLTLLGGDAEILTEGEPVGSYELFDRLISKEVVTGEEEKIEDSELKYFNIIKEIRKNNQELFDKIKRIPKKSRTAKLIDEKLSDYKNYLLTYFRSGKLHKFFIVSKGKEPIEVDFITAAKILESSENTPKENLPEDFYDLLNKNKIAFENAIITEEEKPFTKKGRSYEIDFLKIIKYLRDNPQKFTEDQENYINRLEHQVEVGAIPKKNINKFFKSFNKIKKEDPLDPLKILTLIQKNIPIRLLEKHYAEKQHRENPKTEVILSLYLK